VEAYSFIEQTEEYQLYPKKGIVLMKTEPPKTGKIGLKFYTFGEWM